MRRFCVKLPLVVFVIFNITGHGIIPSDLDIHENTDKVFQNATKHLYTDHCLYNT